MTVWRRTSGALALVLGAAVGVTPVESAAGATWLPGVTASEENSDVTGINNQRVVVDASGAATLVWTAVRPHGEPVRATPFVQTATRLAGAPDFGPVQELGTGGPHDVAVHPDGRVTVAWTAVNTIWVSTRAAGAVDFSAAAPVFPLEAPVAAPELAVDGAGNLTMAWDDSWEGSERLRSSTRDPETGSWSTPATVAEGRVVSDLEVAAAADGTVTFAWTELQPGPGAEHLVRAATQSPGAVADTPEPVDDRPADVDGLMLAVNATGTTALSWIRAGSTDSGVQLAVREATAAAFAGPTQISGAASVLRCRLLVGDDGVVAGGWVEQVDTGARVVGIARAHDGTVTTAPVSVTGATANQLDAVMDPAGTLTLAWSEVEASTGSQRVSAARRSAGGLFEHPVALSDLTDVPLQRPALGADTTGDVTVAYSHGTVSNGVAHVLRSQLLDVNAPTLTATVPATGSPGTALSMSAVAGDLWGPVSVSWSFGDGSSATGTSASHTYAGTGSFVVRVTATDGSGNATTLTRTVKVAPAALVGDRTPPVLTRVRLAPDRLPTGHGSQLKVTSTEAGRLVGVVERRRPYGQWGEVGTKRWSLQAGRGSKTFYGKAAQVRLHSGKHRVRLVATDVAGNASSPVVVRFRVGPR